jgi:hypothetical protein
MNKIEIISNIFRTLATIGIFVVMFYRAIIDRKKLNVEKRKSSKS